MIDENLIFSDSQAVTETAASENVLKIDATMEVAAGKPVDLEVKVVEDFNNVTSLTVAVETATDEDFTSATVLAQTAAILLAELKAGYRFKLPTLPLGNKGYVRLKYTVVGTDATTGKIFAAIVDGAQQSYHN